eukprot:6209570-Pleurochrysis_carterae.AAC.1
MAPAMASGADPEPWPRPEPRHGHGGLKPTSLVVETFFRFHSVSLHPKTIDFFVFELSCAELKL